MSEQKFQPRVWIEVKQRQFTKNTKGSVPIASFSAGVNRKEYLSLAEHQHLMAEKDKRIDRLEHCLEWLAAGFGGMWGSESKMWYDHALETAPDMIRAALQEDGK